VVKLIHQVDKSLTKQKGEICDDPKTNDDCSPGFWIADLRQRQRLESKPLSRPIG
jgi:hypothetical protein